MKIFGLVLAVLAAVPAIAIPIHAADHHYEHGGEHFHTTISVMTVVETASPVNAALTTPTGSSTLAPTNGGGIVPTGSGAGSASSDVPSTIASIGSSALAPPAPQPSASSTNGPLRGANVGNWLILEKWMDDGTVFTGKYANAEDQWSYDQIDTDGSDIRKHWASWFTESDVQKLASFGFNALRIPIGFWAFENQGTPYTQGAADYLDQAIEWARGAGMKVLVDCHGSPGSQNGQEHSGRQGSVQWQQDNNLESSTQILQTMMQRYGGKNNSDVVIGLEIVNEPTASSPNSFATSQAWATQAYQALQQTITDGDLNPSVQIITHDSFMGPTKFIPLLNQIQSPLGSTPTFGVDQHNYQLYTSSDNSEDQPTHIQEACAWSSALATTKQSMPVIVGEWSALTNICVNSDGSTYPGTSCNGAGNCATCPINQWSKALVSEVRKFVEAQLDTFEQNSDGHFIWSAKSGQSSGWSVYDLIDAGAFPNPITERQFPPQCS